MRESLYLFIECLYLFRECLILIKDYFKIDLGTLASFITAIAALLTALLTRKTIKSNKEQLSEMKSQRIESQRPELFIDNIHDIIVDISSQQYSDETILQITQDNRTFSSKKVKVPIINIGNGPARFIKVSIQFDYKRFIEFYNNEYYRDKLSLRYVEEDQNTFYTYELEQLFRGFIHEGDTDIIRLPFIKKDEESYVYLPDKYKLFFDAICMIAPVEISKIPGFYIRLEYLDSYLTKHDKPYENKFYISLDNIMLSKNSSYSLRSDLVE